MQIIYTFFAFIGYSSPKLLEMADISKYFCKPTDVSYLWDRFSHTITGIFSEVHQINNNTPELRDRFFTKPAKFRVVTTEGSATSSAVSRDNAGGRIS